MLNRLYLYSNTSMYESSNTSMNAITAKKEVMNLKEPRKGCVGGLGGRKGKRENAIIL